MSGINFNEGKTSIWRAFAAGLVGLFESEQNSIYTGAGGVPALQVIDGDNTWRGYLQCRAPSALGGDTLELEHCRTIVECFDYRTGYMEWGLETPRPTGCEVVGGTTLSCDTPPDGYAAHVYEWDGGTKRFSYVGPLDTNSQPGAGTYVISLAPDGNDAAAGYPGPFLTISA